MVAPSRASWGRHDPHDQPPRGGPHRVTVVAAIAALVVVVALIALGVSGKGDRRGSGSLPAQAVATTAAAVSGSSLSSAPSTAVADGSQPLTAAPSGVSWQLVDGLALPVSRSDGPARVAGGVPSGFAHTPTGALLACVQIGFRLGSVNPAEQAAVVRAMVTGPGQAGILASRPVAELAVKPQLAGFHYVSYSATAAVIGFAWRITDPATDASRYIGVGELQASWLGGDWRLFDDGGDGPLPSPLDPSLTGYVRFAGA